MPVLCSKVGNSEKSLEFGAQFSSGHHLSLCWHSSLEEELGTAGRGLGAAGLALVVEDEVIDLYPCTDWDSLCLMCA